MKNLFTFNFWFLTRAELTVFAYWFLVIFVFSLSVAWIYIQMTKSRWKKNFWRKSMDSLSGLLIFNFLAGLYLWLVNDQLIPILSARIWFIVWGVEMFCWGFFIKRDFFKAKAKQAEFAATKDLKKYIP